MQRNESALSGKLVDFRPRTLLHFLGLTGKSGALRLDARDRRLVLWFHNGSVVGAGDDGSIDTLDTVVDILRVANGRFSFDEGATLATAGRPQPVAALLESAVEAVVDWEECAQVVPSTALAVELRSVPGDGAVSADAWAVVVAVTAGHLTPDAVADALGWPALRTCRAVKELVEGGRAVLSPAAQARLGTPAGPVGAALTTAVGTERALWPGAGIEGAAWRTPWYADDL